MDTSSDTALASEFANPFLSPFTQWYALYAVVTNVCICKKPKNRYIIYIFLYQHLFLSLFFFLHDGITFLCNITLGDIIDWTDSALKKH